MMEKVILLAISAVFLAQIVEGLTLEREKPEKIGEWVQIDGDVYYIVSFEGYTREHSKAICESYNMRLITFETELKWLKIKDFMASHDYAGQNFWTGAIKDQGSSTWYWQETDEEITNFFWRTNEPDINQNLNQTCIEFSPESGSSGWGDNLCDISCDIVCQ